MKTPTMAVCWTRKSEIEDLAALLDGVPTGDDADGREQADENHQPEAEAIHADVVEDGGLLNPRAVDLELEAALAGDKMRRQMQRETEADERSEQRNPVGEFGAVGHERNQHRPGQRNEQDQRENRLVDCVHCSQCPASSK